MFLGLDTATPYLSLALWSPDSGLVARFTERVDRDHAGRILTELDKLLVQAKVAKIQLEGVGVGVGPGSYTGLRVGIATAKALARTLAIPLRAETTLAAMAHGVLAEEETGIIALDARRGNVYAAIYQKTKTGLELIQAPQKQPLTELKQAKPVLPLFVEAIPDAAYLAKQVTAGGNAVHPLYL